MSFGTQIRTWFEGRWHDSDLHVMRASDHGMWQGSSVFDGARWFDGVCPDLAAHCARVNRSAEALMITPTLAAEEIEQIARDGLRAYDSTTAVYVRPMYWALHGSELGIAPKPGATGFALSLEAVPMPPAKSKQVIPVPPPTEPSATGPDAAESSACSTCSGRTCAPLMSLRYPSSSWSAGFPLIPRTMASLRTAGNMNPNV